MKKRNPNMYTHEDLPQWLQEVVPHRKEDFIIGYDKDHDSFYINDQGMTSFNNVYDAYTYAKDNDYHFVFDDSLIAWCEETQQDDEQEYVENNIKEHENMGYTEKLSREFYKNKESSSTKSMISYKNSDDTYTAMFSNSNSENIHSLVHDIEHFKHVTARAYREKPDQFIYAYHFIQEHPMFWTKTEISPSKQFWCIDGGIEQLSVSFYTEDEHDDDSDIVCMIETGEHIAPDYTDRYFSPLLTVKSDSYENAIIACAQRISQFFYDDGTPKDEYHEKSSKASEKFVQGQYRIGEE